MIVKPSIHKIPTNFSVGPTFPRRYSYWMKKDKFNQYKKSLNYAVEKSQLRAAVQTSGLKLVEGGNGNGGDFSREKKNGCFAQKSNGVSSEPSVSLYEKSNACAMPKRRNSPSFFFFPPFFYPSRKKRREIISWLWMKWSGGNEILVPFFFFLHSLSRSPSPSGLWVCRLIAVVNVEINFAAAAAATRESIKQFFLSSILGQIEF